MSKNCVFTALIAAIFLLCSCDRDEQSANSSEGVLKVELRANNEIINSSTRSSGVNKPSVNDFALKIFQGDEIFMSWDKFSDLKESMIVPTGNYLAKAEFGDVNVEGFDVLPAFYGEKAFTIKEGEVTEVLISSALQNALVNILYSDGFKGYFESYTTKIKTSNNNIVEFVSDETRSAYIKPGTINISLDVLAPGMDQVVTLSAGAIELSAKTIYNITLDANASNATLTISFVDDVAEEHNIEINISDIALNSTAPSQIAVGYQSGVEIDVIESLGIGTIQTQIYSATGLESCMLTTESNFLISKGWPAEVNLVQASAEQLELMKSLGLKLVNFGANDGVVFVDFTNVIPLLEYNADDNVTKFTILSVDKYSKPAVEPTVIVVKSMNNDFSFLLDTNNVAYEATAVTGVLTLNPILDINLVSYQYFTNGVWQSIQPTSIEKVGDEYLLSFTLPAPIIDTTNGLKLKALFGNREITPECKVDVPQLTLELQSIGDVWATRASFTVNIVSPSTRALNNPYVFMEYKSGAGWIKPSQTVNGNAITVTGLNGETSYQFRARYADNAVVPNESVSTEVSITTEAETQVPNADMNGWNVESTKSLAKGMLNGLSPSTYNAYIPNSGSWATTNAKTFNHSSSGRLNYCINAYPSVIYEDRGNGSKAAMIRTIGWTKGSGNEYTSLAYHRSAGKIFLGTYSFDVDDKIDTYNYGIDFTSRPSTISFDYKYDSYNNDKFKVWAVVENRDGGVIKRLAYGEIGAGSATGNYTNTTIKLAYDPVFSNLKATHFYIVFSSSNKCDDTHTVESELLWEPTKMLRVIDSSYWGGSVLYIDNIQLNY